MGDVSSSERGIYISSKDSSSVGYIYQFAWLVTWLEERGLVPVR